MFPLTCIVIIQDPSIVVGGLLHNYETIAYGKLTMMHTKLDGA